VRLVAEQLGRPAEALVELDRRPLRLLVQPGPYLTVTVRDRQTRQVLEPTVDLVTGRLVDASALRERDRAALERRPALTAPLRRLLLRHPDLPRLDVLVRRRDGGVETVATDVDGVLALADDPDVVRIELHGDALVQDGPDPPMTAS
jgi:hypothetical protein